MKYTTQKALSKTEENIKYYTIWKNEIIAIKEFHSKQVGFAQEKINQLDNVIKSLKNLIKLPKKKV